MNSTLKTLARCTGLRRRHLASARMYGERNFLAQFGSLHPRSGGRILCYHSVGQPSWGVNDVTPDRFREQIETALGAGYRFVPPHVLATTGGHPRELAVTFDDGPKSVGRTAAPILAEYDIPWAVFVVTSWSNSDSDDESTMGWRELERIAASGAEIGSHSVTHPDFGRLEPEQAVEELVASGETIRKRLGIDVTSFAIPFGQSGNWPGSFTDCAREAGYRIVYAQGELTRPRDTVGRTFVTRFDRPRVFSAALEGVFDSWEEWF